MAIRARPALPIAVDHDVLRPDADRGRTELPGDVLLRYEIHLGRADEAGDEEVGGAFVEFERRAELLDCPALSTTILSAMVIASTWSWVT